MQTAAQLAAAHIEEVAIELGNLARQHSLSEALSFILEMAVAEAADNQRVLLRVCVQGVTGAVT